MTLIAISMGAGLVSVGPSLRGAQQARASADERPQPAGEAPGPSTAVVRTYCVGCHSDRSRAGGLSLTAFELGRVEQDPEVAEKIIHKLR